MLQVNLFKEDGTVIHFQNPKVQASIGANTYVVSGRAENKNLQDLLPGVINQLGYVDNPETRRFTCMAMARPGGGSLN